MTSSETCRRSGERERFRENEREKIKVEKKSSQLVEASRSGDGLRCDKVYQVMVYYKTYKLGL